MDCIVVETEVSVCEIEYSIYTPIAGRDKDAERTYYDRAWTWLAPAEPGTYYCPIEIIKGLTDKGQFQYLIKLKGPQVGNYLYTTQFVYNTISFTTIKINILS